MPCEGGQARGTRESGRKNMPYTILTDTNFRDEVLTHSGPVLVVFEAAWSGGCQIIAPVITAVASDFEGQVKFARMDMDANERIPQDYGIYHLPTLLVFSQGRIVDHIIGTVSKNELTGRLNALL